jgi:hypothetical protein
VRKKHINSWRPGKAAYLTPNAIDYHHEVDLCFVLRLFKFHEAPKLLKSRACSYPGCKTMLCQDNLKRRARRCFVHQVLHKITKGDQAAGKIYAEELSTFDLTEV